MHTDLTFHPLHGRNTVLTNGGLTASRPNALSEFNDAIVMTNRPLRPGEMFEVGRMRTKTLRSQLDNGIDPHGGAGADRETGGALVGLAGTGRHGHPPGEPRLPIDHDGLVIVAQQLAKSVNL